MIFKLSDFVTASILSLFSISLLPNLAHANQKIAVDFSCGQIYSDKEEEYIFATLYGTSGTSDSEKDTLITWQRDDHSNEGNNAQSRCKEVSDRFQESYDKDTLKYIRNGTINGQPVICTTSEYRGECDVLLLTLLHEDDSEAILRRFYDNLHGLSDAPVQQTDDSVLRDGDDTYIKIDFEKLLSQQ